MNELLGLVKGVIADAALSDAEVVALRQWIDANPMLAETWPANVIAERLRRILSDSIVDEDERADLLALLQRATGESGQAEGAMIRATRLPLDEPPPTLVFRDRLYVLTGRFVTGTRAYCESAVEALGGECAASVTRDTDYLVIGELASEAWVHTTHGRKIEKAVEYRGRGVPIRIVGEEHWAAALRRAKQTG